MTVMESQVTANLTVYTRAYLVYQQSTHQAPHYWSFVMGIHWWLNDSPHKCPAMWKGFCVISWHHYKQIVMWWIFSTGNGNWCKKLCHILQINIAIWKNTTNIYYQALVISFILLLLPWWVNTSRSLDVTFCVLMQINIDPTNSLTTKRKLPHPQQTINTKIIQLSFCTLNNIMFNCTFQSSQ